MVSEVYRKVEDIDAENFHQVSSTSNFVVPSNDQKTRIGGKKNMWLCEGWERAGGMSDWMGRRFVRNQRRIMDRDGECCLSGTSYV